MIFEKNDRILFTGDSVSDFGRRRPVGEGLGEGVGQGYPKTIESFLNVFYPELNLRITNTGIGGNSSRDLLKRYEEDVVKLKPQWLSILIGVNDVLRQFAETTITESYILPGEYRKNITEMISRVKDSVKGIFLMSPFYLESIKEDEVRKCLDEYNAVLREAAEENNCIFVDLQSAFDEYLKSRHSSFIAWDRIHPNQTGAMIIANEFLKNTGFDRSRLL